MQTLAVLCQGDDPTGEAVNVDEVNGRDVHACGGQKGGVNIKGGVVTTDTVPSGHWPAWGPLVATAAIILLPQTVYSFSLLTCFDYHS